MKRPPTPLGERRFVIVVAACITGAFFTRIGQPAVVGEMIAGILLGPSLFGLVAPAVFGFVFAVVMNFASYWFSDKIVLKMYRAQEVGPGHPLYTITERLVRELTPQVPDAK